MTLILAHPLTEAAELGVAPAFVGLLAAVLVVGAARVATIASAGPALVDVPHAVVDAPHAVHLPAAAAGQVIGVGLLVLAILAGRVGNPTQVDNIAPALVIGVGWPLLLLAAALFGGVWDWLNPFDTLARLLERVGGTGPDAGAPPLWPVSVVGALGWTWWLGGYLPGGLEPRAIGLALGLYTLVTLAGCMWAGRVRWLAEAEVFTVTFRAIAASRAPRTEPVPPERLLTLAVLVGGLAYAELRFSAWYRADLEALGIAPSAVPAVLLGFVVVCGIAVAATVSVRRWARRTDVLAALHAAMPWLVVALGLSAAIERDRLWNAAQLLVVQASDPFGRGWDLFGTADAVVTVWRYGEIARLWVQVAVLAAATVAGLTLGLRRVGGRRAEPVVVLVAGWLVLAVLSAASL